MDKYTQLVNGINEIIGLFNTFISADAKMVKMHNDLYSCSMDKGWKEKAMEHKLIATKEKADSIAYIDAVVQLKMLLEKVGKI